jgi:hypothetical protein
VRTFIVRLQEDAGGGDRGGAATPRLRGVVDEVATGLRATFRNQQELVTALMTAVAADRPGQAHGGVDRAAHEPASDDLHEGSGEE